MIPQIMKQFRASTSTTEKPKKQRARSSKQTTKQLSFYGVGNVLEEIGKMTRLRAGKIPGLNTLLRHHASRSVLRALSFDQKPAPWELQYAVQPKTSWGALSNAILQRNQRQRRVVTSEQSNADNLWDGAVLPVSNLNDDQTIPCIDKQKVSTIPSNVASTAPKKSTKMVASRKRNSVTHKAQLSVQKQVFAASHVAVDTPALINKEIVIIGEKKDKGECREGQVKKKITRLKGALNFLSIQNSRQEEERGGVRDFSMSTVGVLAGLLLFLSSVWSLHDILPETNAEIRVQSLTKQTSKIVPGIQIFSYEQKSESTTTTQVHFDAGLFTTGQFEVGNEDLIASTSGDIDLEHYGDTPPDLTKIDWWDDDDDPATRYNWQYRRCFEVDNTASSEDMTQHQIYFDTDTQTLIASSKMLSTGADMRFVSESGNQLPHFVADDINTASTKVWVQIDNIPAGETESICMYYGNTAAPDTGSREDVFSYSTAKPLYYVTQDSANGSVTEFASYSNDNDVTVSGYSNVLNQTDFDSFPISGASLSEVTSVSTTGPISGAYNTNGTDNLVPVSAAGTEFVYRTDRYSNEFSIISPWCNASLTFENGSGNNIFDTASATSSPFAIAAGGALTITTNDTVANGLPNNDVVIIQEVGSDCPVLISHHGTVGGDSYTMFPASDQWYGVGSGSFNVGVLEDATNVTVYKSNGTTVGPILYNRGEGFAINDAGSQGSEVAHRVVADRPVGVQARGDGDGGDAVTFLPVSEMGYRYYIPDVSQYVAIATVAGATTTVDLYHDGSLCGVGAPDDTMTVVANGEFPGKVYFGSTTNGDNIPAGACVVASNPVYAYNEFNTLSDEHNLWNEKQNRQYITPEPTYVVGAQETGMWSIDGTNNWIYRIPVTVTNNATTGIDEYQVSIDLGADVATLFGNTQADGGDIRLAGSIGDGTDNLVYALESFDSSTSSGVLWGKTPSIPAAGSTVMYIYYSPIGVDIAATGPLLWLDAQDSATITHTAGNISNWNDKSGNANHLAQATLADQPALVIDSTKQVVAFNGSHMVDPTGLWTGLTHTDTYVFSAFRNLVLPEDGILFGERIVGGRYEAGAPQNTDIFYQPNRNSQGSITGLYGGDITDYHTMRFEAHDAGTRTVIRDSVTVLATDIGGNDFKGQNRPFSIGGRDDGSLEQSVNMGELIVFSGLLTPAQITSIESYLSQKWVTGPTTSLVTTADYDALWHTAVPMPNFYVVDEIAATVGSMQIISFTDGNTIEVNATPLVVNEGEIATMPVGSGIDQGDVYSATGPLQIGFDSDATDTALPISYAAKEFIMRVGRNADVFSIYAPFAQASVQIQESSAAGFTTLQTVVVPAGSALTVTQNITNGRVVKLLADEPILAFHRNDTSDSKILYPPEQALVESTGKYEIYGVAANALQLAAAVATTVDIYRSDGTSSLGVVLDDTTNFGYTEPGGGGIQGTARGYHIVSDDPIAASSYADSDGSESVSFVSHKEFSDEYILSNPAQYMSVVTRDAGTECRVYDETGVSVTTGPATMDNVPPQVAGGQNLPFVNRVHIGGDDTADGAYFDAGFRLECDDPVYAYFEHHLSAAISDETSWLTWPQARTRNQVEPFIGDIDVSIEEGLYYESGFSGATPVATAQYIFDTSGDPHGVHTYWHEISWDEIITDRGALNSVQQVKIETAYADGPTCATASYSSFTEVTNTTILTTTTDTTQPFHDVISNTKKALIGEQANDHDCLKIQLTLSTGDPALTPKISEFTLGYSVPELLEGQLDTPQINVVGTVGVVDHKYRIGKVITDDPGLINSQAHLSFRSVSSGAPFTTADFEFLELSSDTVNTQFTFPPFPAAPLDAATVSPLDASNQLGIYYIGQRTSGTNEQINMTFNLDIEGVGGPVITRDFILEVEG